MTARHYRELFVWQVSEQFKAAVCQLIAQSSSRIDWRFRSQLLAAADSVSANAEQRLVDGVNHGYYSRDQCIPANRLLKRCF